MARSLQAQGSSATVAGQDPVTAPKSPGGLSRYGNSLGSDYSADQEPGTSRRTTAVPLSHEGSVAGAAPESTGHGQYGGEYHDKVADMQLDRRARIPQSEAIGAARRADAAESSDARDRDHSARDHSAGDLSVDQRLKEEIHQRLIEHPDLDIHDLSVSVRARHATLDGSVPDAPMKQVIVQLVDNVKGVLGVDDQIIVRHLNPDNHATAQAYAVGGQLGDDLQHSGPATFGAASARASALKENEENDKDAGQSSEHDAKSS